MCPNLCPIVSKLLTDRMGECGLTQVKLGFNAWSPSWHLVFADRAAAEMPTREEVNDIKDLIECFLSTQAPDRRIGWTFLIKKQYRW